MHKKRPKIRTGCRVSAAKIYLYHSTKIAKARTHRVEWPTDSSVQKQWSVAYQTHVYQKYVYQNKNNVAKKTLNPKGIARLKKVVVVIAKNFCKFEAEGRKFAKLLISL